MPIIRRKSTIPDDKKFDGQGVDFKSKLIGVSTVLHPRGDEISQDAISELKAIALKNNKERKDHKQKITINITIKGIRLIDEASERIDHAHPIHRISFISHDKDDKRTFGYIVGTKEGYQLFALKTQKEAEVITQALKDLFQEVFKRHQAKKNELEEGEVENIENEEQKTENETETNTKIEAAEDALGRKDSNLLWDELNDQIKEMQQVGGMAHSDSFDMLSDPFRHVGNGGDSEQDDAFDDNFSPDQPTNNINPFDQVRDRASPIKIPSLPSADQLKRSTSNTNNDLFSVDPVQQPPKKSTSYSEDLYALPNPPSRRTTNRPVHIANAPGIIANGPGNVSNGPGIITNGQDDISNDFGSIADGSEPSLIRPSSSYDELKKNINELHKQNIIQHQQQQQQMQQQTFTAVFPNNRAPQQMPVQMQQQQQQQQQQQTSMFPPTPPNPFNGDLNFPSNSLQPGLPARPTPAPRPAPSNPRIPTNPFLSTQRKADSDMGWSGSILQPTPTVKPEPPKASVPELDDPFDFLNGQNFQGPSKPTATVNGSMSNPLTPVNSSTANMELLDLFG